MKCLICWLIGIARLSVLTVQAQDLKVEISPFGWEQVRSVLTCPDGRIVASGEFDSSNSRPPLAIVVLGPNGDVQQRLRTPEGPGDPWQTAFESCLAVLKDGRFLVRGSLQGKLFLLTPNGNVERSLSAEIRDLSAVAAWEQSDGGLLLATEGSNSASVPLVRTTASGSLDSSFAENLKRAWTGYSARGAAMDSQNRILLWWSANAPDREGFSRLNADGTLDRHLLAFLPGQVRGFLAQPDGKIVLFGAFQQIGSIRNLGITRILADGTWDSSFNPAGSLVHPHAILNSFWVSNAILQPDGKIIVSYMVEEIDPSLSPTGSRSVHRLARLSQDGSVDPSFQYKPELDSPRFAPILAIQPGGGVLITQCRDLPIDSCFRYLFRLTSEGRNDETFRFNAASWRVRVRNVSPGREYSLEGSENLRDWRKLDLMGAPIREWSDCPDGFCISFYNSYLSVHGGFYRVVER